MPNPLKPNIPTLDGVADQATRTVLDALKQNVEHMTGRRASRITALPPGATLGNVINKLNEVIDRLQA